MLVGSAASELKLGSTTVTGVRRGAGLIYDSDVAAFQKASGATQVGPILALVDYLKAQSLWDYARFYPMKSAQNAGSGSTVYGLGGLTSNNMTLVNSPTWGSDGVTFASASSQYGNVGDIFNGGDLTIFARVAFASATPTVNEDIAAAYAGLNDERSFIFRRSGVVAGDPFTVVRSSLGTGATAEVYNSTDHIPTTADECIVAQWLASDSRAIWQNKSPLAISLTAGSATTSTYDTDLDVYFAANNDGSAATNYADIDAACLMFITGTSSAPTTTQRETITDLINAL